MPYFDQEFGEEIDTLFKGKFDLLLGRKTYEILAAYWPYYEEAGAGSGIAKLFNQVKKVVVSRSGDVDTRTSSPRAAPSLCMRCSPTTSLTA